MTAIGLVKWFEYSIINCKLQSFRITLDTPAQIFSVECNLPPVFSCFRLLGCKQYRSIKQAGDILLIHNGVEVKPKRHFGFDDIATLPCTADLEIAARLCPE